MANGGDLPARMQAIENWRIEVDSGISWMKRLFSWGFGGVSLIIVLGVVANYVELNSNVRHQRETIDVLRADLKAAVEKASLKEAEAKLERRIERMEERHFKPVNALIHQGTIVSLEGHVLTVNEEGKQKRYVLAKEAAVMFGERQGKIEELRPGMELSFITSDDEIFRVEVIPPAPKR